MFNLAKPLILSLGMGLILFIASTGVAADQNPNYTEMYKTFPNPSANFYAQTHLQNMRQLHEGTVFLLKRYAPLEALITAVELGRPDSESFWIGASSVVPGVGQMINQDYLQGSLLLFASSISWGTIRQLEYTRKRIPAGEHLQPLYYGSMALRNGIMTYAMLHATNSSYREHWDRTEAMWTGAASLVPGVGQAINGDWWEAGGLFVAWSLAAVLTSHLERQIYVSGDESYLVEKPDSPDWAVTWLPGGALFSMTTEW